MKMICNMKFGAAVLHDLIMCHCPRTMCCLSSTGYQDNAQCILYSLSAVLHWFESLWVLHYSQSVVKPHEQRLSRRWVDSSHHTSASDASNHRTTTF